MGTIVYSNLVDLLLEEGDKTKEEIINESINRFGFPDTKELYGEISFQLFLKEKLKDIVKITENKYHILSINYDDVTGRTALLNLFKKGISKYLNQRPHLKKLKEALEMKTKYL